MILNEALSAFEKALEIDPNLAEAWVGKGVVFGKYKKYREAITAYEKAIEINPRLAPAHSNLAELFFDLGNLEGAREEVNRTLDIEENHILALTLKGRIKIENQLYDTATETFEKAIALDHTDLKLFLWHAYAKYLGAEFSCGAKNGKYQESIHSIIAWLTRAEQLTEDFRDEETTAHVLYYLGYFYYRSRDPFTAKEKLQKCIELKSKIRPSARAMLGNIWKYQIRPAWWRFWLVSPQYPWGKRILFFLLSVSVLALLGLHPFTLKWVDPLKINFTLYTILVVFLLFMILFPSIERLKVQDIEVELRAPLAYELGVSPAKMGEEIKRLEIDHEFESAPARKFRSQP